MGDKESAQKELVMEDKNPVESTVSLEENTGSGYREMVYSCMDFIFKDSENIEVKDQVDEVDGRMEQSLKPLVKLTFLKTLFLDIGISLGDVLTDLAQGINLIFDSNWNIQWTTFHYGLVVIGIVWLPVIPVFIHIMTFRNKHCFGSSGNILSRLIKSMIFVSLFPIMPTLMYMKILLMRKRFSSNQEKLSFLAYEQRTHELKSLTGAIESPLQFTLLLWLMMRGILSLPWDQPLSSSCVQDSLGRVACIPSIPMASMIFSLLSILKSVFDLNTSPVASSSYHSITKTKLSLHVFFCYFPFYLGNIIFRLTSYAFILTFIDYWSIIPTIIIYILNLAVCGLHFIQHHHDSVQLPMDNLVDHDPGNDNIEPGDEGHVDEVDGPPALIWTGTEWISRSVHERTNNTKWNITSHTEDKIDDSNDKADIGWKVLNTNNAESVPIDDLDIPSLIDENNTPVFINSVAGFFFPSVYSLFMEKLDLNRKSSSSLPLFQKVLDWQNKVMRSQIFLFNTSILIIVLVIFFLVTFVPSFNYKTNILNFFWFSLAVSFLLLMGLSTLAWSVCVYPASIFSLQATPTKEESIEDKSDTSRSRHVTGDSYRDSLYSASDNIIKEDLGPGRMKIKGAFCLALIFITLCPSIIGILLFKFIPDNQNKVNKLRLRCAKLS